MHPEQWMTIDNAGLFCRPGGFHIDPMEPVSLALITHGHADHARPGHYCVFASAETLDIMRVRYGGSMAKQTVALPYHQRRQFGEPDDPVFVSLIPAGHIIGSCQILIEYRTKRLVISGDFKRRADPTCRPFEPVHCDVFITEATFGLPVFCHPPIAHEIKKLLDSLAAFPDRCHLVGTYALGKCQRVILALREAGYDKPIYLHGALVKLCELYRRYGIELGELCLVSEVTDKRALAGEIVLAPPSALSDRWSRSLPDVRTVMASGWMQIRARARQRKAELPLIISDHCDWPELITTLNDVKPGEVWVTHGREDALVYQAQQMGFKARALSMVGYENDNESG